MALAAGALGALALFACADSTGPQPSCPPRPPASSSAGTASNVSYDIYDGKLVTSVNGQSLTESRPLYVNAVPGQPTMLGFGLISDRPVPESDCLIVANGPAVSAGICQDLTDPSGINYVVIKQGGQLTVTNDTVKLDFDVTVHNLTRPNFGDAGSSGADTPEQKIDAHLHFEGDRHWPPPKPGTHAPVLNMTLSAPRNFLDSPFPTDLRVDKDTKAIDLGGFPEPAPPVRWYDLVGRAKFAVLNNIYDILKQMPVKRGFGLASGVFFQSTEKLPPPKAPSAEGVWGGLDADYVLAPVLPVNDAKAPDRKWKLGDAHPIKVQFRASAGSLAPVNTLTLLPLQGRPLLPNTTYVAWVRKGLGSPSGPLQASAPMQGLSQITEANPKGLPSQSYATQSYPRAVSALSDHGTKLDDLAALTVFTTGAPTDELKALFARTAVPHLSAFHLSEKHDHYCIYESSVKMPEYQSPAAPYQVGDGVLTLLIKGLLGVTFQQVTGGGDISTGASSHDSHDARVVVTVPMHKTMPAKGWAAAAYVRAGAGLDATGSPLADRGRTLPPNQVVNGCLPPYSPDGGTAASPANQLCGGGPGYEFARAGMLGITIDGPQTGSRLVGGDGEFGSLVDACKIDPKSGEDNAMFDVCNPRAIVDNIRQSALEIALIPAMLDQPLRFEGKDDACHLAGAHVDPTRTALMGHSMGATVAPLALSLQSRYRAVVLSGANGSYIENILAKEMPSPLAAQLEQLFGLDYCLDEFSLLSSLFQWAEEPSDPIVYEPGLFADVDAPPPAGAPRRQPPDVLMIQGIGDHYIPPPIANISSMGLRLDIIGPELDVQRPARCVPDPEAAVPRCAATRAARYPVTPVLPLLRYVGAGAVPYPDHGPVTRNRDKGTGTRGVVQYERDESCRQDGHEVAYEIAQARWQYRCFLSSFAHGQAKIWQPPAHAVLDDTLEIDAPCPEP